MTSGPHLGLFFLLWWQIESEGRKEIGVSLPPSLPPSPQEVCDTEVWGRDQSVVYNSKNTFYKAKEIKELECIDRQGKNKLPRDKSAKSYNRAVTQALLSSDLSSSVNVLPHGGKRWSNSNTDRGLEVPVDSGQIS